MRQIGILLFFSLTAQFGTAQTYHPDLDGNGIVGVGDLLLLLGEYGSVFDPVIFGCTYPDACNFNPQAGQDDGSCLFNGDALGICGGNCPADVDNDGVCDTVDDCVGTLDACGVCNGPGPIYACGCAEVPEGDCDCQGNQLDVLGVCGGDGEPVDRWVTFRVDMSDYGGSFNQVYLSGSFNAWCGNCTPMADENGDGIWSRSVLLPSGVHEYKFSVDDWADSESLEEGGPCTTTNFGYTNRVFTLYATSLVLETVCWEACTGCLASPCDDSCLTAPGRTEPVTFNGAQMLLGAVPFHMKGVNWAPTPLGSGPGDYFAQAVSGDADMMQAAGINTVRTFNPIMDEAVLDTLHAHGIHVLMTVFYGYSDTPELAASRVCALKHHPAIIGWQVGNEWNLNLLDNGSTFQQAIDLVSQTVDAIKANDTTRPVITTWGSWVPPQSVIDELAEVDMWGMNIYTGPSFYNFFNEWAAVTDKPFYFAEYGCDAYDGTAGAVDEGTQASIVASLTQEIFDQASVNGSGLCTGGMVFEWNDEWWKGPGEWGEHDTSASWQNNGYPDPNIHEEWWGIVDIFRVPREAYFTYAGLTPPE